MPSLSLLEKLTASTNQRAAAFIQDRCLRKRLNCYECVNCIDVCAAGAISLRDRYISLDSSACTGCMLCTTACPNDAFNFPGFDSLSLVFAEEKAEFLIISCSRQSQIYPDERIVPCLGGITTDHLLALTVNGLSDIAFNVSSCADCENYHGVTDFLHRLAWLKQKTNSLLKRKCFIVTDQKEVTALNRSVRRSFLSGLRKNLFISIGSLFSFPIEENSMSAVRTSRRIPARVRLKKSLMQQVASKHRQALSILINHRLIVGQACNLCPLCTGICPTGAIKVERIDGKKELMFDSTLCSGCGLCVSFCKQKTLSLKKPDSWAVPADPATPLPSSITPFFDIVSTESA